MGSVYAQWIEADGRFAFRTKASAGAIEITDDQHAALMTAQQQGQIIIRDDDGSPVAASPIQNVADARRQQSLILDTACTANIYAGFDSNALGAAYHYPAQDKDQQNLAASVLASLLPDQPSDWTTPFWCADSAGTWAFRVHTAAQIQQVGRDGKAAIVAALTQNATLQAQVAVADTIDAIQAIVWPGASQ